MIQWIRRLHIYAGLLNFSMLLVFGLAGLVVTMEAPDIFHSGSGPAVTTVPFTAPPSASDKEVAALIETTVHPANAGRPVVRRNPAHQLVADFYSVNGLLRTTLDEKSGQLRIETFRNSIWRFIDNAHATTISENSAGTSVRLWAWYIELSIFSLIFMAVTGVWLGMGARWRYLWTWISFAGGTIAFAAIYILER